MLVTGANVTGLAKRMERCGFIERKNDVKDERLTMLHITPLGLKTLNAIQEIQERHVSEYLQAYSPEQKEEIPLDDPGNYPQRKASGRLQILRATMTETRTFLRMSVCRWRREARLVRRFNY